MPLWRSVCWRNHLLTCCVANLQGEQRIRLSPVVWLPACTAASTTHAVLLSSFLMISRHPPQEVSNWEQLESDGSSPFRDTHHISKEVCAPPHDTLNEDISRFHVFQHLAPNPADHFPCPLWQIFFFQPVFFTQFRQAFENVMWHFRDSLVHFNCASGPSSFVAVSRLELHVPAWQHPRRCDCCRRVSHVRQSPHQRLRAQPPQDRCPIRTSDRGPAPCRRSHLSRKMGACGACEAGRSSLKFPTEKCEPSMCTCAGSTRARETVESRV